MKRQSGSSAVNYVGESGLYVYVCVVWIICVCNVDCVSVCIV